MKSFGDFIFECYKYAFVLFEGKYSDEHAFRKVWNHFITHRKYGKEIRDLINSGKYDEAREAMEKEIAASREDPKHPLSFEKAKRGFEAGKNTDVNLSQSTYYDELRLAPDSVVAYTKGRRGKSAANRPTAYAKVEGGSTPPTTRMWKDVVGKESDTSKRDISIADTRNKRFGQGISLKQGEGSQTLSAEPEEVRGLFQSAAKKYIQQLKRNGAPKEDIEKFEDDLESNISKYVRAQSLKISPTDNKVKSDKRLSIAQSAVDTLVKNYPGFDRLIDKEAASGEQKFGKKVSAQLDPESQEFKDSLTALRIKIGKVAKKDLPKDERERVSKILSKYKTYQQLSDLIKSSPSGQATEVVRGTYVDPKTGEVISRAKSEPVSQRGELDQPLAARSGKGKSTARESGFGASEKIRRGEEPQRIPRSGALAGRVGPAKPDVDEKSKQQQTFKDFSAQITASQQTLADAEKEQADANVIKYPNGKPVPRKNRYYLQNNPDAAQQHAARQEVAAQAVQRAQTTFADVQARAAQAAERSKPKPKPEPTKSQPKSELQRTEPVDTKSKQQSTLQTREPSRPEPQQPQQQKPQTQPQQQQPAQTQPKKKPQGQQPQM